MEKMRQVDWQTALEFRDGQIRKQQQQNENKRHCDVFVFAVVNFGVSDD